MGVVGGKLAYVLRTTYACYAFWQIGYLLVVKTYERYVIGVGIEFFA